MSRIAFALIITVNLIGTHAFAQPKLNLPPAKNGKLANLTQVMVPHTTCVALSEPHRWLAFGHHVNYPHAHVSLVKLDAKGVPSAGAQTLKLPYPAAPSLAKNKNYPLALAFHPKLPLLYVWQDFNMVYDNPPTPHPADVNQFDHLLIYDLSKEKAELIVALCRGPEYRFNFVAAGLLVDPTGSYLYIPNMREAAPKDGKYQAGRFELDELGLPRLDPADAKLPLAARVQKINALNATKPITPNDRTIPEHLTTFQFNAIGAAHSFYAADKERVLIGTVHGLVVWRPEDKNITQHSISWPLGTNARVNYHPDYPAAFTAVQGQRSMYRSEYSDGYLTGIPQDLVFPDSEVGGTPMFLPKLKKLAVGGVNRIFLFDLDAMAKPSLDYHQVPVLNPLVQSLVYSPAFDQLYVGVEVSK